MSKKHALLSVSDKSGIVEFARGLVSCGYELLSTGGTSRALKDAGLAVRDISDYTGFPEMMDGRVKTLHPKVHGGLLMVRGNKKHETAATAHGIEPIDLVCVNLYPFEQTVAKLGCTLEEAVENIDIGGPSMLRSAAKNYRFVTVVTDPIDYPRVLAELKEKGETTLALREDLALKVFALTSRYDGAIHGWLSETLRSQAAVHLSYHDGEELRYGENPHQRAWVYPTGEAPSVPAGRLLHGKAMSYNNYLDADASFQTAMEFAGEAAAVVVKHGNPCGIATGATLLEALEKAWEGDIVSSYGSVITLTHPVDLATASFLKGKFVEVLIAPSFLEDALAFLKAKSKDLRLIETGPLDAAEEGRAGVEYRFVRGALLAQSPDDTVLEKLEPVTRARLSDADEPLARFAYKAVKHVKSNAIVIAHAYKPGGFMVLGMGAGQPNRVDSIRKLARAKAEENLTRLYGGDPAKYLGESILASDAFFPFADNIEIAHELGIRKIVQPGGSLKDPEVIAACDRYGIAMAFTGVRHFRH
ncbi:MAG: bifunctional phosphoribosylaminoimidazolecarboxamide formyltransferase/IMP cyclohydrolase [Spirochaetes bacterium]|nr:bifunctional phosphoribosylaminoimidazolecarboxamide formyltransferase/IMP cyclohydrolase [Spirochaetota bacterium]